MRISPSRHFRGQSHRNTWLAVSARMRRLFCWMLLFCGFAAPALGAGAEWGRDYEQAKKTAKQLNRPLLVHFYAEWCGPCRQMDAEFLSDPQLARQLAEGFVLVKLNSDNHRPLAKQLHVEKLPGDVILSPDGRILAKGEGYQDRQTYLSGCARTHGDWKRSQNVAVVRQRDPDLSRAKTPLLDTGRSLQRTPGPALAPTEKNRPDATPLEMPSWAIGLRGFSPVSLRYDQKWRLGNKEFAWFYQGIIYYMATQDELDEFRKSPERFAPRMLGCDPVLLAETERAQPGSTRYAAYFEGELYLFKSEETRKKFKENSAKYVRVRQAVRLDDLQSTRG